MCGCKKWDDAVIAFEDVEKNGGYDFGRQL
jgi:hypothetical protein